MERQEVLDEILRRVQTAGGRLTQTVKSLAEELHEKPERLYYLIHSFTDNGQIATVSHGPNGTEFLLPAAGGRTVPARHRAASPSGRGRRAGRSSAAAGSAFCPWCGQAVQGQWRFCAACGISLPKAR